MSAGNGPPTAVDAGLPLSDFTYIRDLIHHHAGIALDDSKSYLVSSRLKPLARREELDTVSQLIAKLRGMPFGRLHVAAIEALATTETSFFRDLHPFDSLRTEIIPDLIRRRRVSRTLAIWSAACSSGQEPHSVALLIKEHFPMLDGWNLTLLASDLSSEMLDRARQGQYLQHEINRGLPAPLLVRYFSQEGTRWHIRHEVRDMFRYFQQNILHDWSTIPPLDILILRNVLIYFDVETRRQILRRVRRVLRPDGYLLLGTAETTLNLDDSFARLKIGRSVFYQPKGSSGP